MAVFLQLLPILLPIITPWITALLQHFLPPSALPAVNAMLGAIAAHLMGGDPVTGAVISHIVRSGIAHEPAVPPSLALKKP